MSTYKLTYFNAKGIAESIRMLLSYSGKEFKDIRIEHNDWLKCKSKTPFGQLPILEIDNKVLYQSTAICRYLGEESHLAGKNNWENLQINMMAECFLDFKNNIIDLFFEENKEAKEKKSLEVKNQIIPFYLGRFDRIIQENNGFFALGKLSWFDFYFVGYSETLETIVQEKVCEQFPHISQLRKNIFDIPKVQRWLKKRPSTLY
uniref:glutathione transferase n=1 Tax=Rhodnius prolixus TaxID=13249 RepID=R4G888_RHOPR